MPVIYPLMPKGVEHTGKTRNDCHVGLVIYPLMPKGVEHLQDPEIRLGLAMR